MSDIGLYEAMSTLRAVRRLRPDPVPDEVVERALRAATWAPTGGNQQPWRVIAVRDPAKKASLGELYAKSWHAYVDQHRAMIENAPDEAKARVEKMFSAGNHLAAHFGETPVVLVFCFNPAHMAITDAKLDRVLARLDADPG